MSHALSVPSGRALLAATRENQRLGHENLGFLSPEHGFLPAAPPRHTLPASHGAWDEVAAALPALFRELGLRRAIDELPVLPAGPDDLADADLLRAATVLGVLSHAYHYVNVTRPAGLPPSLALPWQEVRRRLGRPQPVLSYIDLIVYNWRPRDTSAPLLMTAPNLRLLVPTVDTAAERVFYLTQTEILARCTPIVVAVVRAQEAVAADDAAGLEPELVVIRNALRRIVRASLPTIDPNPRSATYVDPVVWAKTVAPLAVPMQPGLLGPSGTSSPVFNLLDAFFRRRVHESQLGREIRQHRLSYPPHWQRFLAGVDELSVPGYVAAKGRSSLHGLLDEAFAAYAGPDGFLAHHRRKVFGYLEMAFKVGRNVTIGGFAGPFVDRTWQQVDSELRRSSGERHATTPPGAVAELAATRPPAGADGPSRGRARAVGSAFTTRIPVSDVVLHNDEDHGFWLVVDGAVLDVTRLRRGHPGGPAALDLHAGTDATATYRRVHGGSTAAARLRAAHEIGRLAQPSLATAQLDGSGVDVRGLYDSWIRCTYLVVEMQNAFRYDIKLLRSVTTRGEDAMAATPYKLERAVQTHERFLAESVPPIIGAFDELWRLSSDRPDVGARLPDRLRDAWDTERARVAMRNASGLYRGIAAAASTNDAVALADIERRCMAVNASCEAFLRDAKLTLREGVRVLETGVVDDSATTLADALLRTLTPVPRLLEELVADHRETNSA